MVIWGDTFKGVIEVIWHHTPISHRRCRLVARYIRLLPLVQRHGCGLLKFGKYYAKISGHIYLVVLYLLALIIIGLLIIQSVAWANNADFNVPATGERCTLRAFVRLWERES